MPKRKTKKEADSLLLQIEKRRILRFFWVIGLITVAVLTFLIKPIYTYSINDVLWKNGALPYILEIVILLCDVFFYTFSFTSFVYSLCMFRSPADFVICFFSLSVIGRLGDLIITWAIHQSVFADPLIDISILFALDAVMIGLLFLCVSQKILRHRKQKMEMIKAASIAKKDLPQEAKEELYPFVKKFSRHNLLQYSAMISAVMISGTHILTRMIGDIGYGAPQSAAEIWVMIAYYGTDLLLLPISYLLALLLLEHFFQIKGRIARSKDSLTDS